MPRAEVVEGDRVKPCGGQLFAGNGTDLTGTTSHENCFGVVVVH